MDFTDNPFQILEAKLTDDRKRLTELADERNLEGDWPILGQSLSILINPRKRLIAEIAWLPQSSIQNLDDLLKLAFIGPGKSPPPEKKILKLLEFNKLTPIAAANLIAAGLKRLKTSQSSLIHKWLIFLSNLFDKINPIETMDQINCDRKTAGFPLICDLALVRDAILGRRTYFREIMRSALDQLKPQVLVETITLTVTAATLLGRRACPPLIADLVNLYEVEAQEFLAIEDRNIDLTVTKLIYAIQNKSPEPILEDIIKQLNSIIYNWNLISKPIRICANSQGIIHKNSQKLSNKIQILVFDIIPDKIPKNLSKSIINALKDSLADDKNLTKTILDNYTTFIRTKKTGS